MIDRDAVFSASRHDATVKSVGAGVGDSSQLNYFKAIFKRGGASLSCLQKEGGQNVKKGPCCSELFKSGCGDSKKRGTLPKSFNSLFEIVSRTTSNSTYHWMLAPVSPKEMLVRTNLSSSPPLERAPGS